MAKLQPLCRCCGKPIAKRVTANWFRLPGTGGNNLDNRYWKTHYVDAYPTTREECQRLTNEVILTAKAGKNTGKISNFNSWDGESYVDPFFCKERCAADFGRMCARSGKGTIEYIAALEKQRQKAEAA